MFSHRTLWGVHNSDLILGQTGRKSATKWIKMYMSSTCHFSNTDNLTASNKGFKWKTARGHKFPGHYIWHFSSSIIVPENFPCEYYSTIVPFSTTPFAASQLEAKVGKSYFSIFDLGRSRVTYRSWTNSGFVVIEEVSILILVKTTALYLGLNKNYAHWKVKC